MQLDLREKGIVKREADLLLREQACTVKEADLSASNHKLAAAAENMRAQWDQFNKERAEVEQAFKVAQEQLANAQVQAGASQGPLCQQVDRGCQLMLVRIRSDSCEPGPACSGGTSVSQLEFAHRAAKLT